MDDFISMNISLKVMRFMAEFSFNDLRKVLKWMYSHSREDHAMVVKVVRMLDEDKKS